MSGYLSAHVRRARFLELGCPYICCACFGRAQILRCLAVASLLVMCVRVVVCVHVCVCVCVCARRCVAVCVCVGVMDERGEQVNLLLM